MFLHSLIEYRNENRTNGNKYIRLYTACQAELAFIFLGTNFFQTRMSKFYVNLIALNFKQFC